MLVAQTATHGAKSLTLASKASFVVAAQHPARRRPCPAAATKHVRFVSSTAVRSVEQTPTNQSHGPSHFKDHASHAEQWKSSRPHEDWTIAHPVYTEDELHAVSVVNRTPVTMGDKVAHSMVKLLRWGFDVVTRYKNPAPERAGEVAKAKGKESLTIQEMREEQLIMTPEQWLMRILFLETIAGVPGMVAAMLRHFKSLRMKGRDGGWILQLLGEAENERMHLMIFLKVKSLMDKPPGFLFKSMVAISQGVFANLFFLSYVLSPRSAHRFVGALEQEAVYTYTKAIQDLEAGRLPEWEAMDAPTIAKDYWRLRTDAKMIDVLYAVRADEANHRFVNHSLASIGPTVGAINPFAMKEPPMEVKGGKAEFTKEESEEWGASVKRDILQRRKEVEEQEKRGEAAV